VPDVPTAAEIGRRLDDFKIEYREDRRDLQHQLNSLVSSGVYTADKSSLSAQIDALRKDIERRADSRKWLIAGVIVPLGIEIVTVYIALKGVG
jgi:hypothetical protein